MSELTGSIGKNVAAIQAEVLEISRRLNRTPPRILGATKRKSTAEVLAAANAGIQLFGENYAQELERKADEVKELEPKASIEWHFIGSLQKNKVKKVIPYSRCIQTVDSIELAQAIDRLCSQHNQSIDVMIEVNTGDEATKSGVPISGAESLVSQLNSLTNIQLTGLMTIPPAAASLSGERRYYQALRELLSDLNKKSVYRAPLSELSMGMSHDYALAIEEGSTLIRIGEKIFGPRV